MYRGISGEANLIKVEVFRRPWMGIVDDVADCKLLYLNIVELLHWMVVNNSAGTSHLRQVRKNMGIMLKRE